MREKSVDYWTGFAIVLFVWPAAFVLLVAVLPRFSRLAEFWIAYAAAILVRQLLRSRFASDHESERDIDLRARSAGRRDIGWLAQRVLRPDGVVRPSVSRALVRVLPRMTEAEWQDLTAAERRALLAHLDWRIADEEPEMLCATLGVVRRYGDRGVVPAVRRLAQFDPSSPGGERVRSAARECLGVVESRAKEIEEQQRLARPAQPPQTLLHPHARPSSEAEETLPRAVDSDR